MTDTLHFTPPREIQVMGFEHADNTKGNPKDITGGLDTLYKTFLADEQQHIAVTIHSLEDTIRNLHTNNNDIAAQIESHQQTLQDKDEELKTIKESKGIYQQKYMIEFVIGTFITILLTLFVILFYSSTAFIVFDNITKITRVFLPEAWSLVFNQDDAGALVAMMVLFPIIFLGLGFLIHTFLSKKKYIPIIIFVAITLVADMMIGLNITEKIYNTANSENIRRQLMPHFQISDAFADKQFYTFLLLGFVVYVIWGFLLHHILAHPYLEADYEIIKKIKDEIAKLKQLITEKIAVQKNNTLLIDQHKSEINKLKDSRTIPVNTAHLKSYANTWTTGWQSYINNAIADEQQAVAINDKAIAMKENWLNEKIKSLQ